MKRAMIYPVLLFLISPLFGADADYSAMFGSDKLKAASAVYEKFGYVSPLVELAKTDATARKKLDELVADLKSKSEKRVNEYGMRPVSTAVPSNSARVPNCST